MRTHLLTGCWFHRTTAAAAAVLLTLLALPVPTAGAAPFDPISTELVPDAEDEMDKNLTNDEIGNDPDVPTNFNIDRIDPGEVRKDLC